MNLLKTNKLHTMKMKTGKIRQLATACICALAASVGCTREAQLPGNGTGGPWSTTVKLSAPEAWEEDRLDGIFALRFDGGILQETVHPERAGQDGSYTFRTESLDGILYIFANASNTGLPDRMVPGESTEDDLRAVTAGTDEMTASGILMTGSTVPGSRSSVAMKRSVARLDLNVAETDVVVNEVKVTGLADKGYVMQPEKISVPGQASRPELSCSFADTPPGYGRSRLMYMAEQTAADAAVEVTAEFGGGTHRLRATLPGTIIRNNIYTVNVYGSGGGIAVTVSDGDWEDGGSTGSEAELKGVIDPEASVIPEGVTLNRGRDTVFVSHLPESFTLSVLAEPGAEVSAEGSVRGVEINVGAASRSGLTTAASVSVRSPLRFPGSARERMYLNIRKDGLLTGRIVLIFEPNPVKISGLLKLDEEGKCDFGRYVDGELARLSLPEGRILTVEFASGEAEWMKAVLQDEAGDSGPSREYRLLGGWKPNDPGADGRVQEGKIVISDEDGSDREEYTVSRLNWGLPVVKIGETWWCKYNLRGNVKSFSDQITCNIDPAADDRVAGLLASEPESVLLELMGDQYQGGNPDGLRLMHDGTAFYYEGMKASGQNFGTLDPESMAPDGYRIPDYEDYAFFSASDNYNIGGTGTRTFRNISGKEVTVTVTEREVSFLWNRYGTVAFYDFEHEGSHWVLYGLGHQWSTTAGDIARMNILLATHSGNGNSWNMEGYAMSDRPGQNWMKFTAHNSTKTRTIRCIKTPVEYIYK